MYEFTPLSAFISGLFIGLSALVLWLCLGRIAGISGIFSRSLFAQRENAWQLFFLIGLILGPLLTTPFGYSLPSEISIPWWQIIAGGFFVGLGSQLGSGCTSGHGICGIGRGSVRSIVATLVFMLVAFVTVGVVHG